MIVLAKLGTIIVTIIFGITGICFVLVSFRKQKGLLLITRVVVFILGLLILYGVFALCNSVF